MHTFPFDIDETGNFREKCVVDVKPASFSSFKCQVESSRTVKHTTGIWLVSQMKLDDVLCKTGSSQRNLARK